MISFGDYKRDPAQHTERWCGTCGKVTAHYFKLHHTTVEQDCYECSRCWDLMFVKVPDAPKLTVVLPD